MNYLYNILGNNFTVMISIRDIAIISKSKNMESVSNCYPFQLWDWGLADYSI